MNLEPDWILLALCGIAVVLTVLTGALRLWPRLLVLGLLGVIALQPSWGGEDENSPPSGTDIVLMIDRTTSMAAQDYAGSRPRMDGVAEDVATIVAAMPAARYTVVTFDNEARIAAPWTSDISAIVTLAETMGWREEGYGLGSDISTGLPLVERLLESSEAARPQASRYVVYFGDGEQTSEQAPRSFEPLAPYVDDALVLGYGTDEGGVMAQRVDTEELVTRDGISQLSTIDEANLQQIADDLGARYLHRSAPGDLTLWPDDASTAWAQDQEPAVRWGWVLAPLAALVMGFDLWRTGAAARQARREVTS